MTQAHPNEVDAHLRKVKEILDFLLERNRQALWQGDVSLAQKWQKLAEQTGLLLTRIQDLADPGGPPDRAGQASGAIAQIERPTEIPVAPRKNHTFSLKNHEDFPKFWVRGNALVKQGLQRNKQDVYEHTVPKEKFDEIVRHLQTMASYRENKRQKEFKTDEVQEGVNCPPYMTYVVISLLHRQGLLDKARKGAYLFAAPESFFSDVDRLWRELQT
jgi:hypothetical protein